MNRRGQGRDLRRREDALSFILLSQQARHHLPGRVGQRRLVIGELLWERVHLAAHMLSPASYPAMATAAFHLHVHAYRNEYEIL
jgi:hypothetical protein